MKNLHYAIMFLLLPACSAETTDRIATPTPPDPEPADSMVMGFSATTTEGARGGTRAETYTGAGVLNTERLRQKGFGVYCWYTGTVDFDQWQAHSHISDYTVYELMRNQKVEWDASAAEPQWTYAPVKYWPLKANEKLTLRAYAPYTPYMVFTPADLAEYRGTPYLPVQVRADDYCNNTQHDPLWGTSRHDTGGDATTRDPDYGLHYDNYTFAMSGTDLTADARDGVIDWYFHHGMAMLALQATLGADDPNIEVRITGIHTGPFYNEGLLDIFNSPVEKAGDAPIWYDRRYPAGDNFYVDLACDHTTTTPAHHDLTGTVLQAGVYQNVAVNGLLVIPRDFSGDPDMLIRLTYTKTNKTSGTVETKTVDAHLNLNVVGNVVYWIQMLLDVDENTLLIRSFVNLDWQVGSYGLLDEL